MSNMILKSNLIPLLKIKFNRNNIRFYRPVNYDIESHTIEKMKKYDLPIEVINTLKQHEISINNIEKQLIENNKLFYSLLKHNNKFNKENGNENTCNDCSNNCDERKL